MNSAASCPQFHSLQISQISNVEKQRILTIEIRQPGFKRSYYLWSENNTILTEVIGALVRWFYLLLWERSQEVQELSHVKHAYLFFLSLLFKALSNLLWLYWKSSSNNTFLFILWVVTSCASFPSITYLTQFLCG